LRDTLNYLQNLGINAIEVMPFNEFEGNNSWGYNPDYYFAPDKYYGPKNTLLRFVDSCHSRGISVIMDMVLNHTTNQSPFAQLYWNAATNLPAANNPWLNVTAPHPFSVFNDFNHESLATRYLFSRVVEHWLTLYKLDGFRFDLSKGFTQFNSGTNVALWGQYDSSRVAIWKRYYDSCQLKSPGSYVILEHFADNSEEIDLSNYGMLLWGNEAYNYGQASMGIPTDWNFEWGIYTVRNWSQPNLVTYMESHDEERIMYKNENFGSSASAYDIKDLNTGLKRVEQNAAFLFTIPGPKLFWQFGEQGYDYTINYCENGTVSNNCRLDKKPIRWDYLQNIQRKRLVDIFSALIKLRSHPLYKDVFLSNQITRNLSSAFKWLQVNTDSSKICVIGNFDVVPVTGTVTFQTAGTWYDYLNGSTFNATGTPQTLPLQPGEYHVYLNRNVVNTVTTAVNPVISSENILLVKLIPNPVHSATIIKIDVPESGNVTMDLLNNLGQTVQKVYSGFLSKGEHQVEFRPNGRYPAGGYFLKINTRSGIRTERMIIE
jgi:glycosidase